MPDGGMHRASSCALEMGRGQELAKGVRQGYVRALTCVSFFSVDVSFTRIR